MYRSGVDEKIEKVDGGWVSYGAPSGGGSGKVRFCDTKPYYAPLSVDYLTGPSEGMIKLPHHIHWGSGDRLFSLTKRGSLYQAYQAILESGSVEDIQTYINKNVLMSIWNYLKIPPRLSRLWTERVAGL
jgi:hypothetical protein